MIMYKKKLLQSTQTVFLIAACILTSAFSALNEITTSVESTTEQYVEVFYPLWFTYHQSQNSVNKLVGPDRMGPEYGAVVAPNDDTLYANAFMNLKDEPVVLTIYPTTVTASVLALDAYGNVFKTGIESGTPGTYALVGPNWTGSLPENVNRIDVPVIFSNWIIRVDKYSPNGRDEQEAAERFRQALRASTLSAYLQDPSQGAPTIVPVEEFFSRQYKVEANNLMVRDPITFLKQLQTAVKADTTPPLSNAEEQLAENFDNIFGNGDVDDPEFISGVRNARVKIVQHYQQNEGATKWITFDNIGAWQYHYLDRAAITEYIQYGNNLSAAAYYQAFKDGEGNLLDTTRNSVYVLTFSPEQIPKAKRFWSLTAYIPESITLVENEKEKYLVASYTPGLQTNPDGSISIYMSTECPEGVPEANWLPVPYGAFNVLLRVYGPDDNEVEYYVPPAIVGQK
jgi:hypothetical protein